MTKWYINNTCVDSSSYDDGTNVHFSGSERVADSRAVISGSLPLNNSQNFGSFELYENDDARFYDYAADVYMSAALDRIEWLILKGEYIPKGQFAETLQQFGVSCSSPSGRCGLGSAHMLLLADICDFVKAADGRVKNDEEKALIKDLQTAGLIAIDENDGCSAPRNSAIVALTKLSPPDERRSMFRHEYSHVLFDTNIEYFKAALGTWKNISISDRAYILSAIVAIGLYRFEDVLTEAIAYSANYTCGSGDDWKHVMSIDRDFCSNTTDSVACGILGLGDFGIDVVADAILAMEATASPYMPDID